MRNIQLIKPIKRMEKAMKIEKRIVDIQEEQDCPFTTFEVKQRGLNRFKFLISKKILILGKSFYANEQLPEYYWTNQLDKEFEKQESYDHLYDFRRKLHEQKEIIQLKASAISKSQLLKQYFKEAGIHLKPTNCLATSPKTVKKKNNIKLPIENRSQPVEGIKSQAIQSFDVSFNIMQQKPEQREDQCNKLLFELQKISNFDIGHNQFII